MTDHLPQRLAAMREAEKDPRKISDYALDGIARDYAADILDGLDLSGLTADSDPQDWSDDIEDAAHEAADSSGWVIYTARAIQLCANCDTSAGEEFLEDVGTPKEPTFGGLASIIAYGELRHRIRDACLDLLGERIKGAAE